MCLVAAALQLFALVPGRKARLPVLLKAATAGTHSAAMLALLECDTRQVSVTIIGYISVKLTSRRQMKSCEHKQV